MKRFRFPLDTYLAVLRREMEAAQSKCLELHRQQHAARRRSDALLQQRQAALQRLSQAEPIAGDELRGLDAWRTSLAEQAMAVQHTAAKLERPIQEEKLHALEIGRRVELLAKLREQRVSEHRRLEDRQLEQAAAELHLAGRHRRDK